MLVGADDEVNVPLVTSVEDGTSSVDDSTVVTLDEEDIVVSRICAETGV